MAILYDLRRRNRYDVTYDVIYANEACNATNSRHMAGTGSSPVRIVLITKMGPPVSPCYISMQQENRMFEANALGESEPEQLLRTVIYLLGLHLALRGGVEHTRLHRPGLDCQITTHVDEISGSEYLLYQEDALQKTNQGGLNSKPSQRIVKVFAGNDLRRCPVRLFGKYVGLLPQGRSCGKLYLRPKKKPTPSVWFCDQPYGKNKVGSTVRELCKIAKIEGRYSNHCLRATSASRMFQQKIPEQII